MWTQHLSRSAGGWEGRTRPNLQNVQPKHPSHEAEGDQGDDNVPEPLTGGFGSVRRVTELWYQV